MPYVGTGASTPGTSEPLDAVRMVDASATKRPAHKREMRFSCFTLKENLVRMLLPHP
jgi:hypothetical protein